MPDEELGEFVFTITPVRKPDGLIWLETNWANHGVPRDSVIMKLRALTRWLENQYYSGFDQHAAQVERK